MLRASLLLVSSLLSVQVAWAEGVAPDTAPSTAASAVVESESQQFARARLMEMAKFLSGKEKFSVTLRTGYDVVQDNGQKIEFGEVRELLVQRPDHVRIEERASHGDRDLMLFNGKVITMLDGASGYFAQAPQPGDIDTTVVYFVRDLKMRLPLAPLIMSRFPEELQSRVQRVDYVERTEIHGEPAHHIAARTANVDFQAWISDSKRPLPLRIVMTYRLLEGQPNFWAEFSQWNLTPRIGKTAFVLKQMPEQKRIVFAVQVRSPSSTEQPGAAQNPEGGKP